MPPDIIIAVRLVYKSCKKVTSLLNHVYTNKAI